VLPLDNTYNPWVRRTKDWKQNENNKMLKFFSVSQHPAMHALHYQFVLSSVCLSLEGNSSIRKYQLKAKMGNTIAYKKCQNPGTKTLHSEH